MNAGWLNTRVLIRKPSTTQDAVGQLTTAFTDYGSRWANIKHNSGAESIKAGADTSVVKASIRVRRDVNLTAGMRVVDGTRTYQVKAVMHDAVNKEYTDMVVELLT